MTTHAHGVTKKCVCVCAGVQLRSVDSLIPNVTLFSFFHSSLFFLQGVEPSEYTVKRYGFNKKRVRPISLRHLSGHDTLSPGRSKKRLLPEAVEPPCIITSTKLILSRWVNQAQQRSDLPSSQREKCEQSCVDMVIYYCHLSFEVGDGETELSMLILPPPLLKG